MTNSYNIQNANNIFSQFYKYENWKNNNNSEYGQFRLNHNKTKDTVKLKNDENKEKNKFGGLKLYSSVVTVGILSLLLAKGVHGSSLKDLINKSTWVHSDAKETTINYMKKGMRMALKGLQASSNFTTIKDILFAELCKKNKFLTNFANSARNLEKTVINKTLSEKYDKSGIKVNNIISLIQNFSLRDIGNFDGNQVIKIKKESKTLNEWMMELNQECVTLQNEFINNFGLGAREARNELRDKKLKGLGDRIFDQLFNNDGWKRVENYEHYITEKTAKPIQNQMRKIVVNSRRAVTNSIDCICNNIYRDLLRLRAFPRTKDKVLEKLLTSVEKDFKTYRALSGINEDVERRVLSEKIIQDIDDTVRIFSLRNLTKNEIEELNDILYSVKNELWTVETSKGPLEKIMTIMHGFSVAQTKEGTKILEESEFKKIKKIAGNISHVLDENAARESEEYFLKCAEMEVGSAATDIFSVLLTVGAGAYALTDCNSKEERISAALKTCVPLIGSFGAFIYCNVQMLSGAKNLLFSLGSGVVLNKIGTYLDNLYKDYKKSGSVVKVAKEEYKTILSDLSNKN